MFINLLAPFMESIFYWLKYSLICVTKETFLLLERKAVRVKLATPFSLIIIMWGCPPVG